MGNCNKCYYSRRSPYFASWTQPRSVPVTMIKYWSVFISVVAMCIAVMPTPAKSQPCGQPICTQNTSRPAGDRRWDWAIFIDPQSSYLDQIKCVEYTLHPTYPDPVRTVCVLGSIDQPFVLRSNGWGTFRIEVRVLYRDGSIRELGHDLEFHDRPFELGHAPQSMPRGHHRADIALR